MALPFRSIAFLKQALGEAADPVVDYIQARRKEDEEKQFYGQFESYMGQDQNKGIAEASGLTPQLAWMLGGRNMPGAFGATMGSAKARTPSRDVFGNKDTGYFERVSPAVGSGPSDIKPIEGTKPTGFSQFEDSTWKANLTLAQMKAKKLRDQGVEIDDADVIEEALKNQERMVANTAAARTEASEEAKGPFKRAQEKREDDQEIDLLLDVVRQAKNEMAYLLERNPKVDIAPRGPGVAAYRAALKKRTDAISKLNSIGKKYKRQFNDSGEEVGKSESRVTPSGIEYEVQD